MTKRQGDRFVKPGDPAALQVEHHKSTSGWALGQESGLFHVPRILAWDEAEGVLEFEFVPAFRPLGQLVEEAHPRASDLLRQAGRALACIHDSLEVPEAMTRELPSEWLDDEEPSVCVHGDFTMNNVGWDEAGDSIVVVDWSTTPMIDPMATIASPYYDVHWFVFHLFYGIPLRGRIMPDSRGAADAFLDGYASERSFSEASFERLRRAQADHYEREIADSTATRSAITKMPYSVVQRARFRRWASYRPPAQG